MSRAGDKSPPLLCVPEFDQLKHFKAQRSSIKGQITKFSNFLKLIEPSTALNPIQANELTIKLNKFTNYLSTLDDISMRIEILDHENLEVELSERDAMESQLHYCIATAQHLLEAHKPQVDAQERTQSSSCSGRCSPSHDSLGFRLPQIQIHKFDGNFHKWFEFRDTFESLIHNNPKILPIHKFHYLRSYLEGEAARVIANLEMSSANYEMAWDLLYNRFNNSRQLIFNHLNSLLNFEPIQRESDKPLRFLGDHITKNLRALKSLDQPTEYWDTIVVHIMANKLDSVTHSKWDEYRNSLTDMPTLERFQLFLKERADVLESQRASKDKNTKPQFSIQNKTKPSAHQNSSFLISAEGAKAQRSCVVCQGLHRIFDCKVFRALTVDEKWIQVNKHRLCHNCLRPDHETSRCRLMGGCRACKKRHNTILHKSPNTSETSASLASTSSHLSQDAQDYSGIISSSSTMSASSVMSEVASREVLLSTAIIDIVNPATQQVVSARALLDSGSQSSFITANLRLRLQLTSQTPEATSILGIGDFVLNAMPECCSALVKSKQSTFTQLHTFLVLPHIAERLPKRYIQANQLNIPSSFGLADPSFNTPSQIDVLLGADIFWQLLTNEHHSLGTGFPLLHNSTLGWLISGPVYFNHHHLNKQLHCNFISLDNLESQLTNFWEYEDFPSDCQQMQITESEQHFLANTSRQPNGRFTVKLPLLDSLDCLGDSYFSAKKRFLHLEKRLNNNQELKQRYHDFIREYKDLGHLSEAHVQKPFSSYFLPHHAVLKDNSESTKLRVVFDASARTSSGFSINDILMVGPNIQDSLFNILLRFRHYAHVLSGDIEKQYRQILMHDEHRDMQLILWREDESLPIRTLRLNTVTYGFASSSFLAARCLWQLGEEASDPSIKTIIQRDFYCDDLLTGADSESELLHIKQAVSASLNQAGFPLRKYRSNSQLVLDSEAESVDSTSLALSQSCQTLGLGWCPKADTLLFAVNPGADSNTYTKRSILSSTFKVFDPLGLLTLYTIKPKILIQRLWSAKLGWDDPVPNDIRAFWLRFINNIQNIKRLTVPRYILCSSPEYIELHSFSDASQAAYGACIFIKSSSSSGITTHLLCSKSRVSPLKTNTIPRLELCAALLSARLASAVIAAFRKPISRSVFWSDSSVVLGWLNTCPSKLKTYVANRVSKIQSLTKDHIWRYVPTADNPADLASRGVDPQVIDSLDIWWHGPSFLKEPEEKWPTLPQHEQPVTLPEIKTIKAFLVHSAQSDFTEVIDLSRFSSYTKLLNTVAYILRFINIKCKKQIISGPLTSSELKDALHTLVKLSQQQSFPKEISTLQQGKLLSPRSNLVSLAPFLDTQAILRVGGRLEKSSLDFPMKHPMLLSSKHTFTTLLFKHEHKRLLHAGPQLMLASLREQFWPIAGRDLARRTAAQCVQCRRHYAKTSYNIMGNLPNQRLTPDFPFLSVALDFAGPFMITDRRGRGCKITKCYLCLFICLRYKCIHLEAVSELSKEAFILSLRRFIARRGKPIEIFCDNGRNFVAAAGEIESLAKHCSTSITEFATEQGIKFIFSPPYSPNFNGYAEAGIKSAKFHIKRILGNTHLTFEELATLFSQVEAILNSRPLTPLSSSPNDLTALTPGHFLLGRPLMSLPSPDLTEHPTSRLSRFHLLEQVRQHFWQRWQAEYVMELQQRTKWKTRAKDLKENDLVLIKEDMTPPLQWRMGRIAKLYPGADGVPRVADVKTTRGIVRRGLNRICTLLEA